MLQLKKNVPILYKLFLFLLVFELCSVFIAPLLIPRPWYLSLYLGKKSQESALRFLKGEDFLIADEFTGWKTRPGVKYKTWAIDSHGSRSTHDFSAQKTKPIRALFLGSSMINGGMGIQNDETISAYLEDSDIESLNFGTMLYTIDQCLLAYLHRLYVYNPDVTIVGIDGFPVAGLRNIYVPFLYRQEKYMPFFKPRFTLHGDSLQLVHTSPANLAKVLDDPHILDFLSQNDAYYCNFERFQRFEMLPLSNALLRVYLKIRDMLNIVSGVNRDDMLLETLMQEMVNENKKRGSAVIFIILPDQTIYSRSGMLHFLPDVYDQTIKELRSKGFHIVDVRTIFRKSGKTADELFEPDQRHYRPLANRIIAKALYPLINKVSVEKTIQMAASLPHKD